MSGIEEVMFLDSYALSGAVQHDVDALTNGCKDVEAILNQARPELVRMRRRLAHQVCGVPEECLIKALSVPALSQHTAPHR